MSPRVVAVDVGGTDMKAALVDGDASELAARSLPTPATPAGIVDAIATLVDELGEAQAIGLAVPGVVDEDRGAARAKEVLRAGDPDALAVWDEALDALAAAVAWIASVLAPEAVVIGGGLSRAGAALFDPLNERIPRHLTFQRVPRLVPAALGDRAGCMGAALLALDSIRAAT